MTGTEAIQIADELVVNPFSASVKLMLLNQIEAKIQHEVYLLGEEDCIQYDSQSVQTSQLLLSAPFNDVYISWLKAMYYWHMAETEDYERERAMFETVYTALKRYVAERVHPGSGKAEAQGYYLSAYGIAVKGGYNGTEEEWLESLKGEPGTPGLPEYTAEDAGKVLTVSEAGAAVWTAVANAEEVAV